MIKKNLAMALLIVIQIHGYLIKVPRTNVGSSYGSDWETVGSRSKKNAEKKIGSIKKYYILLTLR